MDSLEYVQIEKQNTKRRTKMKFNLRSFHKFVIFALTLIVAFTILMPAQVAFAQGEEPPTEAERGERVKLRLEAAYQRELKALDNQQKRLDNTGNVAAKVEDLIARARENGRDVTALEAALASYREGVAKAQAAHDEAAAILDAHAGFDGNGKVTSIPEAAQTVNLARKHLTEAHRILDRSARQLRQDIHNWLKDQRPKGEGE
jgi:hypothetical protein